jgi:hypothetical protein
MDSNNLEKNEKIRSTNLLNYKNSFLEYNLIPDSLDKIINEKTLSKYLTEADMNRLQKFMPYNMKPNSKEMPHILSKLLTEKSKIISPLDTFKNMIENNYFSKNYQTFLSYLEIESLETYIGYYQKAYKKLKENRSTLYSLKLKELEASEDEKEQTNNELPNNLEESFEMNSENASSGYTTLLSEEEKEIEMEKLEQVSDVQKENKISEPEGGVHGQYEGLLSEERFRNLKINKNQLTIRPRTKEELKEFQKQELERYKSPHLPWMYHNSDGSVSVVAPVLKKIPSSSTSKPREHVMLKPDRPSYVTILCLARDAASRLPEGVGTRADICDLLKDSQYTNERLSDSQVIY